VPERLRTAVEPVGAGRAGEEENHG